MMDIKTKGVSTLNKLVDILKKYPGLLSCKTLDITVSGDMSDPSLWKDFPIRPDHADKHKFQKHSNWNGKDELSVADRDKIIKLRDEAHSKGKKLRFWAIPDFDNGWKTLMDLPNSYHQHRSCSGGSVVHQVIEITKADSHVFDSEAS